MTRSEWLEVGDENYQRAAYAAFSSDQRLFFWLHKLEELKKMDWSEKENEHLQKMQFFISENLQLFEDGDLSEDNQKITDIFFYKWMEYAQEKLGWNKDLVASMFVEGEKMLDKNGAIIAKGNSTKKLKNGSETIEGNKCDCIQKPSMDTPESCNKNNKKTCWHTICDKEKSQKGCGWLWKDACDGRCRDNY